MAISEAAINEIIAAAMQQFTESPIYVEATAQGWENPLYRYAEATAKYQAQIICKVPTRSMENGLNANDIFGDGMNNRLVQCDEDAMYLYQQWQRQQRQLCANGKVSIRVPIQHRARLQETAIAEQNAAASQSSEN